MQNQLDKRRAYLDNQIIDVDDHLVNEQVLDEGVVDFDEGIKNGLGLVLGVVGRELLELGGGNNDWVGDVVGLILVYLQELQFGLVPAPFVCLLHDEFQVRHIQIKGFEGLLNLSMILNDRKGNFLQLKVYRLGFVFRDFFFLLVKLINNNKFLAIVKYHVNNCRHEVLCDTFFIELNLLFVFQIIGIDC